MTLARTEAKMSLTDSVFDLSIDSATSDLTNEDSFDTDILMSLFTDKRAVESQIVQSYKRRGWLGDTVADLENYTLGSWLWLIEQKRLTNATINEAVSFVQNSLEWITDTNLATRVVVTGERDGLKDIKVTVKIYVNKDLVSTYAVTLWENSYYSN